MALGLCLPVSCDMLGRAYQSIGRSTNTCQKLVAFWHDSDLVLSHTAQLYLFISLCAVLTGTNLKVQDLAQVASQLLIWLACSGTLTHITLRPLRLWHFVVAQSSQSWRIVEATVIRKTAANHCSNSGRRVGRALCYCGWHLT